MSRHPSRGLGIPAAIVALAAPLDAGTHQDFDNPGAPYLLCSHFPGAPAAVMRDARDFSGKHLRLASMPATNHNSAVFDTIVPGPACRVNVSIDFDFRMTPEGPGSRADGLGLALLNAAHYGKRECVDPEPPFWVAEEPTFLDSLGLGFDIHRRDPPPPAPPEVSDNHVSVHWAGTVQEFDVPRAKLDLARGDWIHARVQLRGDGPDGRLSLELKPRGPDAAVLVVDDHLLPGFAPYAWRVWLGARSGGESAEHDVDNLHVTVSGCPELDGRWEPAVDLGRVAIHASLLPNGKVLFWDRHDYPPGGHLPWLWDPATPGEPPLPAADPKYDLFCAGHAYRADGRLFVAGGHIEDGNGEPRASTYDPWKDAWEEHAPMNNGRWYPTSTTLADGSLLTVSGDYFENGTPPALRNTLPQVFVPATGLWRDLVTAVKWQPLYPFMFLGPDGRVFDAGPQQATRYLDATGTGQWSFLGLSGHGHRDYGSAVMHRPGKVMILGGSQPAPYPEPPTNSVETIDLLGRRPRWSPSPHMSYARRQHTATLLADGTVLVTGGSSAKGFQNLLGAVRPAELFDPATNRWRTLAAMRAARMYHSTALLLPSGQVLVAGGGHPSDGGNGEADDHFDAEVFSPPYLFRGPRPAIAAAPTAVGYGQLFVVETPDGASITHVAWVRLGSVTHGFDQNQRFAWLPFTREPGRGATHLRVAAPADAATAPPGPYMLFLLRDGVPSVARIVLIN